mgnify:CR=1 FL=1
MSGDFVAPHYVRFTVNDKPGILAQVTTAYARYGINIEGVLQLPKFRKDRLPFVTTLEECSESVLDRALAEVAQSDYHVQPPLALPDLFVTWRTRRAYSEVVEAEGHLIDSQILERRLRHGREEQCDVRRPEVRHRQEQRRSRPRFRCGFRRPTEQILGQVLEELVALGCRLAEQHDALLRPADRDGCVPDDFYSTTNHRTHVRQRGQWIEVEHQRMDAVIVVEQGRAICRKLRDVNAGDAVVCGVGGRASHSRVPGPRPPRLRVHDERDLVGAARRGRRVTHRDADAGGEGGRRPHRRRRRVRSWCTPAGRTYFQELDSRRLRRRPAGRATRLAVHDVEQALFGTSLGVDLDTGKAIEGGHRHHMRAINTICRAGGLKAAVEQGVLTSGVMYECIRHDVDYVLAGSIRDDGPLPDTIMDLRVRAGSLRRQRCEDVRLVLVAVDDAARHRRGEHAAVVGEDGVVSTSIPAVVTKLADRGSSQTLGIVTDVGLFLHRLAQRLRA